MTSPHEPDKTGPGAKTPDPAAAGRTGPEPTRSGSTGEVAPPWQRGAARRAPSGAAPDAGKTPPGDSRPERVLSGTAARPQRDKADPTVTRVESARPDAQADSYRSELPDLSGPARTTTAPRKRTTPAASTSTTAKRSPASTTSSGIQVARRGGGPVRASMQIRRIDPWTTLKAALILSVALFFAWMIAVAFLYLILGAMGVWSKLNDTVGDLLQQTNVSTGGDMISASSIFGGATLIGLVNIVLLTAMAALGAFVYNLAADLVGGVEVTLADRE